MIGKWLCWPCFLSVEKGWGTAREGTKDEEILGDGSCTQTYIKITIIPLHSSAAMSSVKRR